MNGAWKSWLLAAALAGTGFLIGRWATAWWTPAAPDRPETLHSTSRPSPATRPVPVVPAAPLGPPGPTPTVTPAIPSPPAPARPPQAEVSPVTPSPAASRPSTGGPSLDALNDVRHLAHLAAAKRLPALEGQCAAHARYLVLTDRGEHREDPTSPHRTALGEACAPGHYFVSSRPDASAARAMQYWATGAFHLPQLLDPRLAGAALAVQHDGRGDVQSAVVLDVTRGRQGTPRYPVRFPAPDTRSDLTTAATHEFPDPLAGCPAHPGPTGAPIALLLGPGRSVRAAALKVNGRPAPACLLTAPTFHGASPAETDLGQRILAAQGVAILLPLQPLPPGAAVKVSFSTPAGQDRWTFNVK